MTSRILRLSLIIVAAIGAGSAGVSRAQSDDAPAEQLLNSPFVLDAGLFVLGQNTKANLNGQGVDNPEVDFNKTFGSGADARRFRLDGLWRITKRQHLEFMYFTNSISRTKEIPEDDPLKWGDYQFSGSVTAKTRLSIYELGYEYAFVRNQTLEIAGSFGIHYTKATLDLSGNATVIGPGGEVTQVTGATKEGSVPAPLPVIGLRAGWAFAGNWLLEGQVQIFDFSYDGFHGNWSDFRAGVIYMFNQHVGVGAGYDNFSTHLSLNQSNFDGHLNLGYNGGLIYIRGAL